MSGPHGRNEVASKAGDEALELGRSALSIGSFGSGLSPCSAMLTISGRKERNV